MASFGQKYPNEVEVKVADYSSLQEIQNSLDNMDLVFSQIAPIVAIDNILAFVKKTPTEDDLAEALGIAPQPSMVPLPARSCNCG